MFNTPAILSLFIPVATAATGILMGWFLGRKRANAETNLLELQNLQKLIEIWQKMAKDIKEEYENLKEENKFLISQMSELEKKMDALKDENDKLLRALKEIKKQQGKQ
jgi:septal ring factor EnvC (AmiA/AmiB activator)